ncbi:MAG: DnaJ domain-containing protein [Candidatus Caldarchaeum sp.]
MSNDGMTPLEAGAVVFTVLTAVVALFSLGYFRKPTAHRVEWPYAVLGVDPGAPINLVKKSYRDMVKRYHPDRLPSNSSPQVKRLFEERLIQINSAYKTIMALYNEKSPQLRVSENDLKIVDEMVKRLDRVIEQMSQPAEIAEQAYRAAEALVRLVHSSAGLVGRGDNYYDMLTDLMMNDMITLEQFNTLVEVRKLWKKTEKRGLRDATAAARQVKWVYLKIRERYLLNADA